MSFDLIVSTKSTPKNLLQKWEQGFKKLGFVVEICPDFVFEKWEDGFVPIRVSKVPSWLKISLKEDVYAGFELTIDDEINEVYFSSSMLRSKLDFAVQCYGAALFAVSCKASLDDPQSGKSYREESAILNAAKKEIVAYKSKNDEFIPFIGWEEVGVKTTPKKTTLKKNNATKKVEKKVPTSKKVVAKKKAVTSKTTKAQTTVDKKLPSKKSTNKSIKSPKASVKLSAKPAKKVVTTKKPALKKSSKGVSSSASTNKAATKSSRAKPKRS